MKAFFYKWGVKVFLSFIVAIFLSACIAQTPEDENSTPKKITFDDDIKDKTLADYTSLGIIQQIALSLEFNTGNTSDAYTKISYTDPTTTYETYSPAAGNYAYLFYYFPQTDKDYIVNLPVCIRGYDEDSKERIYNEEVCGNFSKPPIGGFPRKFRNSRGVAQPEGASVLLKDIANDIDYRGHTLNFYGFTTEPNTNVAYYFKLPSVEIPA